MDNPCKGCIQRKAGCGASCTKWAAYTVERNAEYKKRLREADVEQGLTEHFRHISKRAEYIIKDRMRGRK